LHAHVSKLLISAEHDLTLVAGIKYVSSAYFDVKLPGVTECRSDVAMTTYDEFSPMAESWMMMAVIARSSGFWPICLVQCGRGKMIQSN